MSLSRRHSQAFYQLGIRQLPLNTLRWRKVTKDKTVFPTDEAIRSAFYLADRDIAAKWTNPLPDWVKILNT